MPIGPALIPLIGTGLNFLGNIFGSHSSSQANAANIAYAREAAFRDRKWALEDWERNNKYNSPEQQMLRLKQGGLNPNLVYGGGAQTTAQPVRSTSSPMPQLRSYQPDFTGAVNSLMSFYDIKTKQLQQDLVQKQIDMLEYDKNQKVAQTNKIVAETPGVQATSNVKQATQDVAIATSNANLKSIEARTSNINTATSHIAGMENREKALFKTKKELMEAQIDQTIQNTNLSREQQQKVREEIGKVINEKTLQSTEIMLRKMGISWNDELQYRLIATGIDNIIKMFKKK